MPITYLNYFLASIIAYLGLLLGITLIKMAPEEQKPGKKYFILIKKIILFLIIASFFVYLKINLIILSLLLLFTLILFANRKITLESTLLVYLMLGLFFSLSSKIFDLFIIESTLIFLYGISTASFAFNPRKRNYKEIFMKNIWFFVPVILLYFML